MSQVSANQPDIESASEQYARRFSGTVGKYLLERQEQLVMSSIEGKGLKILEVGGGHAQLTPAIIENGHTLTVLASHECCANRLKPYQDSLEFQVGKLTQIPYEDESFDYVIGMRLMAHLEDGDALIRECCRVASRGVILDYSDKRSLNCLSNLLFTFKKGFEKDTRKFHLQNRKFFRQAFTQNGYADVGFKTQFFLPLVLHRALKCVPVSRVMESICAILGMRYLFGSPVIVSAVRS